MSETVVPSSTRDYYERYIDWTAFEPMAAHLNALISGRPDVDWLDWLGDSRPPFGRALSLNCGNGWVERALFERGVIESVVGVDLSEESLVAAQRDAELLGLSAEYIGIDANTDDLPAGPFDLVLNYAALHHVAFIDRVVRGLREVIADDGRLVHYDYTGPHRNQYDTEAWAATLEFNELLPAELRHEGLCYPHLPTMLSVDPTEAVHSELILQTLDRYFDAEVIVPLGGAIAYQLLHENVTLHERRTTAEGAAALERIIEVDGDYTAGDPARSVFTFAVLSPRSGALDDAEQLAAWTEHERVRERDAAGHGNEYYPRTAFGLVYRDLADEQMKALHLRVSLDDALAAPAPTISHTTTVVRRVRGFTGRFVRRALRLLGRN